MNNHEKEQDLEKTGENDAGVASFNDFDYISNNKEPYNDLAFIADVYSKGEDDEDVTVAKVGEAFFDNIDSM